MKIIMARNGSARREVDLAEIMVQDLWHVAERAESDEDTKAILHTWHLAHDLLIALKAVDELHEFDKAL